MSIIIAKAGESIETMGSDIYFVGTGVLTVGGQGNTIYNADVLHLSGMGNKMATCANSATIEGMGNKWWAVNINVSGMGNSTRRGAGRTTVPIPEVPVDDVTRGVETIHLGPGVVIGNIGGQGNTTHVNNGSSIIVNSSGASSSSKPTTVSMDTTGKTTVTDGQNTVHIPAGNTVRVVDGQNNSS